jgi:hypothetical protein
MIISDNNHHKVDVVFDTDPVNGRIWTQISIFYKKSNTEWLTKTFRLSPETSVQLATLIAENVRLPETNQP